MDDQRLAKKDCDRKLKNLDIVKLITVTNFDRGIKFQRWRNQ